MTLDERIKKFKRSWVRPAEWDSERNLHIKMIFDLIDDREELLRKLVKPRSGIRGEPQ